MTSDKTNTVQSHTQCHENHQSNAREPLVLENLPSRAFEEVAIDLFSHFPILKPDDWTTTHFIRAYWNCETHQRPMDRPLRLLPQVTVHWSHTSQPTTQIENQAFPHRNTRKNSKPLLQTMGQARDNNFSWKQQGLQNLPNCRIYQRNCRFCEMSLSYRILIARSYVGH